MKTDCRTCYHNFSGTPESLACCNCCDDEVNFYQSIKGAQTMNNFLFEDHIDGDFFFVQCDTEEEAWSIVWEEIACDHPCCDYDTYTMYYDLLGCYTDAQAEQMGYDTY